MPAQETGSPRQPHVRKTWLLCLGILTFLSVLADIPLTRQWILTWDVRTAYWLNGLLGHNRHFDIFIARLNGKAGDTVVVVCLALLGLVQICFPWNHREVCQKCAFWGWVGLAFCLPYLLQELAEYMVHRQSPGRVLEGWFNLTAVYHVQTRVRSTSCFPSGHAMAYFFFAIMAVRRYRRTGLFLVVLCTLIPATRIMTGGHWFSDTYLSALPIAAFAAALAYETPLARVNRWLEVALDGCWHTAAHCRQDGLGASAREAWGRFRAELSGSAKADGMAPPPRDE